MTGAAHYGRSFAVRAGDEYVSFARASVAGDKKHARTTRLHMAKTWRTESGARRWCGEHAEEFVGCEVVVGEVRELQFYEIKRLT